MSGTLVGTVELLSRFPVKSTSGEELGSAVVGRRGLQHDREWALYTSDGGIGSGKTTRRFRKLEGLMHWRSTVAPDAADGRERVPVLHSPAGASYRVDDPEAASALSRAFGRSVTLRRETDVPHHDECAVHLVTTSSLRHLEDVVGGPVDARRLRANVLIRTHGTGFVEDSWTGAELALGPEVVLRLGDGMPRCVVIDRSQADVPAGPPLLRPLGETHELVLGVQAQVVRAGLVSVGDEAVLRPR